MHGPCPLEHKYRGSRCLSLSFFLLPPSSPFFLYSFSYIFLSLHFFYIFLSLLFYISTFVVSFVQGCRSIGDGLNNIMVAVGRQVTDSDRLGRYISNGSLQ